MFIQMACMCILYVSDVGVCVGIVVLVVRISCAVLLTMDLKVLFSIGSHVCVCVHWFSLACVVVVIFRWIYTNTVRFQVFFTCTYMCVCVCAQRAHCRCETLRVYRSHWFRSLGSAPECVCGSPSSLLSTFYRKHCIQRRAHRTVRQPKNREQQTHSNKPNRREIPTHAPTETKLRLSRPIVSHPHVLLGVRAHVCVCVLTVRCAGYWAFSM